MPGRPRKTAGESTSSLYAGSDGRWHARVTMGLRPDGTIERRHVSRATRPELRAAVRELERGRDNGEHRWTEHDPTLGVWLEHWLTDIVPRTTRWKTQSTYTSQIRLHVMPTMAHIRLSELQPENLEHLYGYLQDHDRSNHTVRAVHRVLRSALNEAVRRRRMHSNPALVARAPRQETDEVEPLTVGEAQRLLQVAAKRPNAARWSIALSLGLRQGEALGLMWSDLDLEDGTVRIRRSVQRWTWRHGCALTEAGTVECERKRGAECPERTGGGIRLVETKTKGSRRTVVLPLPLVEELKAHRAAQARQRLEVGPDWDSHPRPRLRHQDRRPDRPLPRPRGLAHPPPGRRAAPRPCPRRPSHRGDPAAPARRRPPHRHGDHGLDRDGHRPALHPRRRRAPPTRCPAHRRRAVDQRHGWGLALRRALPDGPRVPVQVPLTSIATARLARGRSRGRHGAPRATSGGCPEPPIARGCTCQDASVSEIEDVTLMAELQPQTADQEIARAVSARHKIARKYVMRLRKRNPEAGPAEIIATLERHYVTAITVAGGVVTAGTIAANVGIALIPGVAAGKEASKGAAKVAVKGAAKTVATKAAKSAATKSAVKGAATSAARTGADASGAPAPSR